MKENQIEEAFYGLLETMPLLLDERQRRLFYGCAAHFYGYGGIKVVCERCGANPRTVMAGIEDLTNPMREQAEDESVRRSGAGRLSVKEKHPEVMKALDEILEGNTFGDPEKVILWTNLSLEKISEELKTRYAIEAGKNVVSRLLEEKGYSKQINQKKMQVGQAHPGREAQFQFINQTAGEFLDNGEPVISVDTKKKELVGNFANKGAEYRPAKNPRSVLDHDFPLPELGKVAPYGIYTLNDNTGFLNLGTDHDTGAFAVESVRRWWYAIGQATFPNARRLYINCDGGGSNGWKVHLWKYELALLAEETGLEIHVSHFPPGTSKWNKIEHRLFCYISRTWEGKPLIDIQTIVNLIGSTTTKTGLKVRCVVDYNKYPTGIKISDKQMACIAIQYPDNDNSWNYIIHGFKKCI